MIKFLFILITYIGNCGKINFLLLDPLQEFIIKNVEVDKLSQHFFEIFNFNSIIKLFYTYNKKKTNKNFKN